MAADHLELPPWYSVGSVVVKRGLYTFAELSEWRDSISVHVLGQVHGVFLSDIDQQNNRVGIGVVREGADGTEAIVRSLLPSLGIPDAAVVFTMGEQPRAAMATAVPLGRPRDAIRLAMLPTPTYLTDEASSLVAGYEIDRIISPPFAEVCSIGMVLDWNGTRYLATASHCGSQFYELDTTDAWYQTYNSSRVVGYEAWDPASTGTYGGFPSRASEVELIKVNSTSATRGGIAHTIYRDSASAGSLELDTSHPPIAVYAASSSPVTGLEVNKVGTKTGWTYGTITNTCDDVAIDPPGDAVTCAIKTNVYTRPGDSGSPLFQWDGE
ncbi:MAG: hypothetical protein KGI63_05575, partial [Xanthomonadaceae bacterium]|nr:hypothetical protein [Xanthomonadaceae bacterium]